MEFFVPEPLIWFFIVESAEAAHVFQGAQTIWGIGCVIETWYMITSLSCFHQESSKAHKGRLCPEEVLLHPSYTEGTALQRV